MLTFVTLFLGLVTGPQPVELAVPSDVARVELLLNGQAAAEIGAAPWVASVDFGASPRPHELVAVAKDSAGKELSRTRQWVNLPRAQAEMRLVLEAIDEAAPRVRVFLRQAGRPKRAGLYVTFDGQPVPSVGHQLYAPPAFDPRSFHLIEATAELEDGTTVSAHLGVGAEYGAEVGAEMTAAPLILRRAGAIPSAAELEGTLLVQGRPAPVLAIEDAAPDLLVVLDPLAHEGLAILGALLNKRAGQPMVTAPNENSGAASAKTAGFQLRLVSAQADQSTQESVRFEAFPVSQPFTQAQGSLPFLLTHLQLAAPRAAPPQISDALAAAGVRASGGSRPRAVLLILGLETKDQSRITATQAREFLESLHVPLFVWSTGRPGSRAVSEDRRPLAVPSPWGSARDVSTPGRLLQAAGELEREVGQQFIAWVEGAHLPRDLAVAAGVEGVALVK